MYSLYSSEIVKLIENDKLSKESEVLSVIGPQTDIFLLLDGLYNLTLKTCNRSISKARFYMRIMNNLFDYACMQHEEKVKDYLMTKNEYFWHCILNEGYNSPNNLRVLYEAYKYGNKLSLVEQKKAAIVTDLVDNYLLPEFYKFFQDKDNICVKNPNNFFMQFADLIDIRTITNKDGKPIFIDSNPTESCINLDGKTSIDFTNLENELKKIENYKTVVKRIYFDDLYYSHQELLDAIYPSYKIKFSIPFNLLNLRKRDFDVDSFMVKKDLYNIKRIVITLDFTYVKSNGYYELCWKSPTDNQYTINLAIISKLQDTPTSLIYSDEDVILKRVVKLLEDNKDRFRIKAPETVIVFTPENSLIDLIFNRKNKPL